MILIIEVTKILRIHELHLVQNDVDVVHHRKRFHVFYHMFIDALSNEKKNLINTNHNNILQIEIQHQLIEISSDSTRRYGGSPHYTASILPIMKEIRNSMSCLLNHTSNEKFLLIFLTVVCKARLSNHATCLKFHGKIRGKKDNLLATVHNVYQAPIILPKEI